MEAFDLSRRLVAEALGTAFLVAGVIGSGIMAARLSGGNDALALLCNTIATGAILVVIITIWSVTASSPDRAWALQSCDIPRHRLAEIAKVNLPVAVLIWLMIIPMLVKIDFAALARVKEHWRGIGVTLFINWAVKPFSMAFLGWLFIGWLFRPYLPADQINSYIAGLILLAAAPCTAMVFVWSNLSDGEPHFTLSQVALNDVIMVFAFAPIVGLLLGLSAITVPWETLLLSVVLYIVVPVIIAQIVRRSVIASGGNDALTRLLSTFSQSRWWRCLPLSAAVRLSRRADPGPALDHRHVGRPILIPAYFNAGLAYVLNRPRAKRIALLGRPRLSAQATSSLAVAAAIACSASTPALRWRRWSEC